MDDYVEIVHNASQNIGEINGNQGTLMALIKRSYSDLPENQWQRILSKKAYFTNSGGYELEFHRNFDHYVLNAQDGSQANGEFQSMGGWDHLAVTFNDSISRVYLNGNDVTKDSVIGPVLPSVDDLWIGLYSAGDTSNTECCTFDGWIDEVALYSKALTKDQIQDVVLNGIEISDDVEAFYNFDQGNGTVVTDLSGNENHGAIYGASWSSDVAESNFSRITFSFDLRGKDVHAEGVHIAGFFNGWEPNVSEMKDEDGDGVYTFEGLFHAGEIVEYKFINGNSWDHEVDQVEDPNCGAATNYNNRTLLVPDFDLVLSPVCINQCVPCSDVPAQPNYSLSFDGQDDYVDFPDGIISDVYNFTLEAWVNVSSFQFWQRVVDFGSSAGNQMFLTTGYENTAFPRFSINNGTGPQIVESSIAIQQNTWHHIAITLSDDNVCKMYIDGVLAGENSSVTLRPNDIGDGNTTNNWIGRSQFDVDEYFHGLIDEIKIWDFDKSQLDIQNGMNLMHDGDEYGLKLYWNFNQSDDDILYNQVSNDFHGTINGPIRSLNAPNSIVSPSIFFPASSNILARYDFSGDADDLSGNENHGSVQGGVTLGIDKNGNTNSAYYFDGSDGSVINCGSGLNLANKSHTISIMAKRESDLDYGHFFSHGTASTSSGLHCRIENGSIKYGFWSNDHDVTNTYSTSTDWHQYVFVYDYDAGTRKIYVDGSLLGSVGTVSAPYQGAGDFVIGSIVSNYGSTQSWKGSLDEIIVWDVALSETDINSIGIVDSTDDNCNDYINGFTYLGSLNDHCYYVSDNQFIWQDARVNATENGGYLASITTAEENAFLTGNVSWFGFTDEITENSFLWTTGEQVDYTNWNSNEPNDSGGEDYTHLNINGTWNDAGSGTRLTYIMEIGGGEVNVSNLNWSLQLRAWQGPFNDYQNFLGVSDSASNGFDFGYDLLEQVSSSENSVSLEFAKPDGPGYSIDTKPTVGLSDTMQVWDFRVKTDFIDGDVFLDFTFDEIPDVPVILENSATGHRHHFTDGFQYIFFAQADSAYSFSLSIGDTIAPSLSIDQAFSGPSIFISDSSYMLEWATGDGYVIDNIQILLSSDGGQTYVEQFSSNNIVSSIDWTVPDLGNIKEGLFLVRARDYAGNEVERSTNHPVTIVGHDLTFGTDAGWNLWGAPISPDSDSMSANLEDDIDGYWVTYDYVQNGYASVGSLKQGGGYWLGLLENSVINIPGTPVDHSYTISLDQGWDLISNPLVLDVLVDSLIFSKSGVSKVYNDAVSDGWINTIYGYNGSGYEVSDKIEAWSGYWIAVLDSGLSMTFPIHDAPVQTQRDNENTESEGWMITFSAETENGLKDNLATLGFNQSASSGFDPIYDAFKAPLAANPDYFSLFILNSDLAHSFGSRLARDFRSEFPESGFHEWIVSLESSVGSANIAWNLHDIPDYYEVGFSIDGGTFYGDMRSASENDNISLSSGNSLIVRVGTTVLGLAGEQIPSVYALSQNYPNPFNPLTKIQYQLPEDNLVKLSIYDIMGRKIKTLVNSTEKAGYKTLIWDATNDQGSSVSAGMYIYTIEAGDFRKTKKMILLK
ncbi:MAG: hypothetical protein CMG04_03720 [Candidatus Marinimicrobia bacterium]|nr:hypothetical protein [Candidatus Neomarinimicrobiota bacterium]